MLRQASWIMAVALVAIATKPVIAQANQISWSLKASNGDVSLTLGDLTIKFNNLKFDGNAEGNDVFTVFGRGTSKMSSIHRHSSGGVDQEINLTYSYQDEVGSLVVNEYEFEIRGSKLAYDGKTYLLSEGKKTLTIGKARQGKDYRNEIELVDPPKIPPHSITEMDKEIISLVNKEREKEYLPPLKFSAKLYEAAYLHAYNMMHLEKMAHELPVRGMQAMTDRVSHVKYPWRSVRENVGQGYRSAQEAMKGWMESEAHRTNILSEDITEIGVASVRDKDGNFYFTQVFASPQ